MVEQAFSTNRIADLRDLSLADPRWQALRQFRLAAAHIPAEQKKQARRALALGLDIVQDGLNRSPNDVELLLLGAMLDGQYLLVSPWRFIHNGRRGLRRLRDAERLAPRNPRVALLRGTAQVVLPRIFGGDPRQAIGLFQRTLSSTEHDSDVFALTPLCEEGEWAQVDLLNWMGRAYSKLGEHEAALASYRRALQRSPGNHWVKLALEGKGYEWSETETQK